MTDTQQHPLPTLSDSFPMEKVPAPPYKPASHLTQLGAISHGQRAPGLVQLFSFQLQNA